jgi:hypothetical protein
MRALPIVRLKEPLSPLPRLSGRPIILHIALLILHCPPQPLDKDVVQRTPPPVHTDLAAGCRSPSCQRKARTLCPLGTSKNMRCGHLKRVFQRLSAAPHIHGDRHRPRQHIPAEPIHHRDPGDKPTMQPPIGNIGTPNLVPPCDRYAPQ